MPDRYVMMVIGYIAALLSLLVACLALMWWGITTIVALSEAYTACQPVCYPCGVASASGDYCTCDCDIEVRRLPDAND